MVDRWDGDTSKFWRERGLASPSSHQHNMEEDDHGHRYGNFPNYYAFNPPTNRIDVLERTGILDYVLRSLQGQNTSHASSSTGKTETDALKVDETASNCEDTSEKSRKKPRLQEGLWQWTVVPAQHVTIYYCDLGCNEGDLTLAMATLLSGNTHGVKCLGIDIDPMLIDRAKYKAKTSGSDSSGLSISASFKTANLCNDAEHNDACLVFETSGANEQINHNANSTSIPHQLFDFTTIFSTTMWIHVHGGDDGLKAFLERACGWTKKFLLVEPQPSAW